MFLPLDKRHLPDRSGLSRVSEVRINVFRILSIYCIFRHVKMSCYKDCELGFHLWCWMEKKKQDGMDGKPDNNYLTTWCSTKDCDSPIAKIEIFDKDPLKPPETITINQTMLNKIVDESLEPGSKGNHKPIAAKKIKNQVTMTAVLGTDLDQKEEECAKLKQVI